MKTIEEIKSTPKTVMKKPELLAPVGDWETLAAAIKAGADYFIKKPIGKDNMNEVEKILYK